MRGQFQGARNRVLPTVSVAFLSNQHSRPVQVLYLEQPGNCRYRIAHQSQFYLAAFRVKVKHTSAWLERTWRNTLIDYPQSDNPVGAFERSLDISAARLGTKSNIGAELIVE